MSVPFVKDRAIGFFADLQSGSAKPGEYVDGGACDGLTAGKLSWRLRGASGDRLRDVLDTPITVDAFRLLCIPPYDQSDPESQVGCKAVLICDDGQTIVSNAISFASEFVGLLSLCSDREGPLGLKFSVGLMASARGGQRFVITPSEEMF